MKKKHTFIKLAASQIHWLVIELVAAYGFTKVIVKGSSMVSGAIDQMLGGKATEIISRGFMLQLISFVGIGFIASLIRDLSASEFSVNIQKQFREAAGNKLTKMEFKYFDDHASGSVLNKMISDLRYAGAFFSEILPVIFRVLIETITIMISIIKMDSMLIVFLAIGYPLVLVISNFASKRLAKLAKHRLEKIDTLNNIAYDNIQGIAVGRSFNLMPVMEQKINRANEEILKFEFRRNKLSSISWMLNSIISWLPNLILATLALLRVLSGSLTIGEMTYFILMLDRIIHPLSELPSLFNEAREMGVSIKRLEGIMTQPDEATGSYRGEGQLERKELCQHQLEDEEKIVIEFDEVSFSYYEGTEVLKEVSFRIKEGQNIAFVGSSGGGKSTIFKLLCGFYQKNSGTYKLCGRNFEEWDINAARQLFALVSQNVFLFPGTIAENVAYGGIDAGLEEVKEACKNANIHDFIMSLPNQYDTLVGERGARLSGGERQRLSIARAFLKDAPILLLDEPTSAIDVGTEELIKEAIERISRGRTVITIAHRLSTIEDADVIFVLDKGKIAEQGTNEELLKQKSTYYELYEIQKQVQDSEKEA